jgi:uncharacterized protein
MSAKTPLEVVQAAYAAFGTGDAPAILAMIAEPCDWQFIGPAAQLAYCGPRRTHAEIMQFFAQVGTIDDLHAFEPREFVAQGDNVAVLGWERMTPKPRGTTFETEWMHLFTVKNGKITRFRGLYDTATSVAARR